MAGKTYLKTGASTWSRVKKIYLKTGGITWSPVRKVYLKTGASTWRKVYDTASNRPFISGNDIPKIRLNTFRTNSTYDPTGTANDPVNPVVEAPPVQQMGPPTTTPTVGWPSGTVGNHLWGYDGTWTSGNGSAITYIYQWLYNLTGNSNDNRFDPQFWVSDTQSSINTSSTGRADMLTNSSNYLGYSDGDYFDKNFLTFRVGASNSAGGPVYAESTPVYIIKQRPSGTIDLINTTVDVPETLSANITYSNEWYRSPRLSDSYVEWFAISAAGEALTTSNRVAIQSLSEVVVTGTTTKSGTVFHNAVEPNKFYTVRLTLNNSNTQAAVIPINGFTPNSPFTVEDSTAPGSALSVTTFNLLDYYDQQGTDNRGYIPAGGLFKIRSNVTGVDGSTTYRIRYRMYNWQNQSYYGMDGTNYGTAASSAWTTRTGSNTSFGFGGTLINNITVSGTTATLTHNESVSSSLFGSTTYDGGQDRWQIEIEVSALKNSVRKYYADVVGGIPYYISRAAINPSFAASPAISQVNQNVTFSGTFSGLGGGNTYPRQYKIFYGDGTDSGYLPVPAYSFGTANPSFSITKQYSATGEYFPYMITMPDYSTSSTSVTISPDLNPPTSITISSVSRYDDNSVLVNLNHSGGSGPYYQMYWVNSASAPTTASYDAAGSGSTISDTIPASNNSTTYFYVRSSTQNLGTTFTSGSATAGTYGPYSSLSPNPSYTFLQPSGTVSVSPSSGTAGTTQFTATPSVSASPSAQISYQWQYNDQASLWLAAPGTSTNSTYTPPSNYNSIYGSLLRCQITANNGVGTQLVANSTAVTITAPATKLTTPTNVVASDTRSDGIQVSWTNVANAATYGVWYGSAPSYDSSPDFGGPNNNGGRTITSSPFLDTSAPVGSRNYYVQAFPSTGSTTFLKSDWSVGDSGTRVAALTAPTSTSISSISRLTDNSIRAVISSSGGSGPYYQLYWISSSTAPTTASYDAASTSSTVTEDFGFGSGTTYYFYIRSSNENLGNTTTNGTATDGTYSAYGPSTGAASYTFAVPTSASASISGSTSAGSTLTLTSSATGGAPTPTLTVINWRRADGGTGGNSFTGGTILQQGGTTYVLTAASVGYSVRAEVTYNNGLTTNVSANSNSIVVTAAATPPTNTSAPTLTPTTIAVGTTLTAGIGTWSGTTPITYDLRIYRGTANVSTGETLVKSAGNVTSTTYTITQADYDSGQRYFRTYVNATNSAGSSGFVGGQERGPAGTAPVSPPTNTSQPTLSGGLTVGSTLTFGVGSWTGSPTSYALRLYRGTQFVATSETLVKNAGNVTSSTYVTTQADYDSGQRYFRAFATATNAGGTSNGGTFTSGQEIGPITLGAAATAPGTPGTPSNGWTGGVTYPFSWSAPTPGTLSGGGAASITQYNVRIYRATDGAGSGSALYTTLTPSPANSTSVTFTAPDGLYYAASVSATNNAGLTGNYSGISQYK